MTADDITVRLPAQLAEQCEARIDGTEFESVDEYVRFVVGAVVDGEGESTDAGTDETDDRDDVTEDVEDRLASLGYR